MPPTAPTPPPPPAPPAPTPAPPAPTPAELKKSEIKTAYDNFFDQYCKLMKEEPNSNTVSNKYLDKLYSELNSINKNLSELKKIFSGRDFYDEFDTSLFGFIRDALITALNNSLDPTSGGMSNANRATSTDVFTNLVNKIKSLQDKYDNQNVSMLLSSIGERVKEFCNTIYTPEAKKTLISDPRNIKMLYDKIIKIRGRNIQNIRGKPNDLANELIGEIELIRNAFDANRTGEFSFNNKSLDIRYLMEYTKSLQIVFGRIADLIKNVKGHIKKDKLDECGYTRLYAFTDSFGKVLSNADKEISTIKLNEIRKDLKNTLKRIYQYLTNINFDDVEQNTKTLLINTCNGFKASAYNPGEITPDQIDGLASIVNTGKEALSSHDDVIKAGKEALKIILSVYKQHYSTPLVDMEIDKLIAGLR